MNLSITFTPDSLGDGALQDVMILLDDHTFRVRFVVENPDDDESSPREVTGRVVGASDTELMIQQSAMKYFIPWEDITELEYQ